MNAVIFKIILKIGLITAGVIILFQVTSLFFIYKYFKFDYYLSAVALFFLVAGILISKYYFSNNAKSEKGTDLLSELTIKERDILKQIIDGKSNKEIAAINFVEVSTIKTHINNIYTKLGLNNRKEAILKYKSHFNEEDLAKIHPFST
jgi:DNA-binding CsgD family transcriptional regulator